MYYRYVLHVLYSGHSTHEFTTGIIALSSFDVTLELTQEGAESSGECVLIVSKLCHSL